MTAREQLPCAVRRHVLGKVPVRLAYGHLDAPAPARSPAMAGRLMSPGMWRRWLKPGLQRVIESARSVASDMPVKYHSDGNVEAVIPDLIEVGVTILNPVQPECMDPIKLRREYGRELAFWGTIGVQSTMPLGSPADVRCAVRRMVRTVGEGGGLVLAPTHSIKADVPWANVVAFYEAAERYGVYR